jgi:hypothetical protein
MYKETIIHYPSGEKDMARINKELSEFWYNAVVQYIQSLNLSDRQIEMLYKSLAEDIAAKNTAGK